MMTMPFRIIILAGFLTLTFFALPLPALAHCDTLNGPVVSAARVALEKGDVTPVLKWVGEAEEAEVREAFRRAMAVRGASAEARELADMYFFETLVRLHRQGEGEPYTGMKPEAEVEPAIAGADLALDTGSVDAVVKRATDGIASGIRQRFALTSNLKKHGDESVTAGREYVKAYVEFIHYVERLDADIKGAPSEPSEHQVRNAGSPASR